MKVNGHNTFAAYLKIKLNKNRNIMKKNRITNVLSDPKLHINKS